jgi:hypothetical protein
VSHYALAVASTPSQIARQERIEGLIGLAAPLLDLMLAAGDRVSRVVGPEDEYYPIRSAGEAFSLPGAEPLPERDAELSDA